MRHCRERRSRRPRRPPPAGAAGKEHGMPDRQTPAPDNTAVRVALWRALHTEVDAPPHVLEDVIGLRLAAPDDHPIAPTAGALGAPEDSWRARPDMDPEFTKRFRAAIVARARFIEDLVVEQAA